MMIRITFLFCFLLHNLLVSGNSLAQLLSAPVQTCPYHQNTYQSPINVPLILQQENIPIYQEPMLQQQPINYNNLYSQFFSAPNLVTPCQSQPANTLNTQTNQIPLNNQINPITSQLSQYYMQKILSNPNIQTILDQNTGVLSQIGAEIPNQIASNIPHPGNVPNVINNYFILPPEFLKDIETEKQKPKRNPKVAHGERNINRQIQDRIHRRRPNHDAGENIPPSEGRLRQKNQPPKREKNDNNNYVQIDEDIEILQSEEDRVRPNRKRVLDSGNRQPLRPNTNQVSQNGKRVHINQKNNKEIVSSAERPKSRYTMKTSSKEASFEGIRKERIHKESIETDEQTLQAPNKKSRKSRDDAFIQDFRKKFPGIPEEVVRSLLSYLRRQLKRQQLGQPRFFYPDMKFPLRYDQLFPNSKLSNENNRQRRPNRRNQNRKSNRTNTPINKKDATESTAFAHTTTEAANKLTETTIILPKLKDNANLKYDNAKTTFIPVQFETTTEYQIPDLGSEDVLPVIDNGIIDDYYPDFTKDSIYFGSDEAYSVRNLRHNRYHYTTDRNFDIDEKSKNKNRHITPKSKVIDEIEDILEKPFDIENPEEEVIEYRTPPSLETPGFRTKPIMRHKSYEKGDNVYFDKSSTYSDAKKPKISDSKGRKNVFNNKKSRVDDIETVYAHSKVVKYGKSEDSSAENATPVVTYYLPENMQFEDDGKTIIVAKKISPDHFWQ